MNASVFQSGSVKYSKKVNLRLITTFNFRQLGNGFFDILYEYGILCYRLQSQCLVHYCIEKFNIGMVGFKYIL